MILEKYRDHMERYQDHVALTRSRDYKCNMFRQNPLCDLDKVHRLAARQAFRGANAALLRGLIV